MLRAHIECVEAAFNSKSSVTDAMIRGVTIHFLFAGGWEGELNALRAADDRGRGVGGKAQLISVSEEFYQGSSLTLKWMKNTWAPRCREAEKVKIIGDVP